MSPTARLGGATTMWSIITFVLLVGLAEASESWSRQLTEENIDWIPLQTSTVNKRQAQARVLNLPSPFQPNFYPGETFQQDYIPQEASRQLFLQPAPEQQGFINQPNSLNQPIQLTLRGRFNPSVQGFIPRAQDYNNEFHQSIQEQFQQPTAQNINNQFYSRVNNEQIKEINSFPPLQQNTVKQETPRYVDGYKVENVSGLFLGSNVEKPSLPSLREKIVESLVVPSSPPVMSDRSSTGMPRPSTTSATTVEKEEVQLLYVPLETLQNKKFDVKEFLKSSQKQNNLVDSVGSPVQINQLFAPTTSSYTRQQNQLKNIQQDLLQQALNTQNLQGSFQNQYQRQGKYQQTSSPTALPFSQTYPTPSITTPRSKKLKAHQPPLAVFTVQKGQNSPKLTDVLSTLKEYKSISVLDTIIPDAPDVFIGPSNLRAPGKYFKFELPYLSSIDGNRIQRKVMQLPFFVAPLSYKAPEGFAKIPFPAPHVGSVIVNPFMVDSASTLQTTGTPGSYSSFSYNPTTEPFRSTVREPISTDINSFNFFPSVTPRPTNLQQTTQSELNSNFGFDKPQFNQYRPQQSTRKPEPNIISSVFPPQNAFFSTSARPSVSYFSFPGPEISTIPTTKPPNQLSYENKGHYITNAAVDLSTPVKYTTSNRDITTQQQTSPLPPSSPKYESQNLYNLNQGFSLKNPYEPNDFRTSIRGNEIRHYNNNNNFRQPTITDQHLFNAFAEPEQKYPNSNTQRPTDGVSSISDYSPRPYITETFPKAIKETKAPQFYESSSPGQYDTYRTRQKDSFSQVSQYSSPAVEDDFVDVTQENQYGTEVPTTIKLTTSTTTTTTTTTTQAPTTTQSTIRRRPIHSRGRPRQTTPKPDDDDVTTVKSTTRRTPIRERKPNTFRTRLENSRTTSTTTESSAETTGAYESSRKTSRDQTKSNYPPRQYNRAKVQGSEVKTTTESPEKATTASRNTRIRMRGRGHFKATEGNDYIPKKKVKTEEDNIAYQRDVLHQNYPVTFSERRTTLEVHTTTPMPRSTSEKDNIRIYETTSNTQRPYSIQELASSEAPFVYQNEAVFQAEPEQYITKPELYVEINGNKPSTASTSHFSTEQDRSTQRIQLSSSPHYEEVTHPEITEENTESVTQTMALEITKEDVHKISASTAAYSPEIAVTEEPTPKFRSKLRQRPKLLQTLNKQNEEENQSIYSDSQISKKAEEVSENGFGISKKPSAINPSTYRPHFSNRRTTMRIEEIEEELKSKRTQLRADSRPTTSKHPVYVPESTSAIPPSENSDEYTSTTKRNHFIRRRPIRPTASAAIESSTASQSTTAKPANKRVRVRGHTRARTTTEKIEISSTGNEEESQSFSSPDEPISTRRTVQQKYVRGRQPAQRHFRRPAPILERNQNTAEHDEDQETYDSIHRPKFVEFNTDSSKNDYLYNPDSGKVENQWSPKLSFNSFRPVFTPNVIPNIIKPEDFEYGTKVNSEEPDIITAGNPYEDVLISVTPASNHLNKVTNTNAPSKTDLRKEKSSKISEATSTFESVLEEVMRNLEEQDENEYNKDYVAVMKHEGGEIGEIPPESTAEKNVYSKDLSDINMDTEIRKITMADIPPTAPTTFADRSFKTTPEVTEESTTIRKPRRRGFWRKVRPAKKDLLDTAESQFYKNSGNELLNNQDIKKTKLDKKEKTTEKQAEKNIYPTTTPKDDVETTISYQPESMRMTQTFSPSVVEKDVVTESIKSQTEQLDRETEEPDLVAMELMNQEINLPVTEEQSTKTEVIQEDSTKTETKTEQLMNPTVIPTLIDEVEEGELTTESKNEISKSVEQLMDRFIMQNTEPTINNTESSNVEDSTFTTAVPKSEPIDIATEKKSKEPEEIMSFSEAMEEILAEVDNMKDPEPNTTLEAVKDNERNTEKDVMQTEEEKVEAETTTPSFIFLDPKSIISTSVSSEISQETEICYRGKCIKTKNQDLKIQSNQ